MRRVKWMAAGMGLATLALAGCVPDPGGYVGAPYGPTGGYYGQGYAAPGYVAPGYVGPGYGGGYGGGGGAYIERGYGYRGPGPIIVPPGGPRIDDDRRRYDRERYDRERITRERFGRERENREQFRDRGDHIDRPRPGRGDLPRQEPPRDRGRPPGDPRGDRP